MNSFKKRIYEIGLAANKHVVLIIAFGVFVLSALLGVIGVFFPFVVKITYTSNPPLFSINWVRADIVLIANLLSLYFLYTLELRGLLVAKIIGSIFIFKELKLSSEEAFGLFRMDYYGTGGRLLYFSMIFTIIAIVLLFVSKIVLGQNLNKDVAAKIQSKDIYLSPTSVKAFYAKLSPRFQKSFIGSILVLVSLFLPFVTFKGDFKIGDCPVAVSEIGAIVTFLFAVF